MDTRTEMGSGKESGPHITHIDLSQMRFIMTVSFIEGYKVTIRVKGDHRNKLKNLQLKGGTVEIKCQDNYTIVAYHAEKPTIESFMEVAKIRRVLLNT